VAGDDPRAKALVSGVRRALAEAKPERTADWKATEKSPGTYEAPA
jgi:hypothetical protein